MMASATGLSMRSLMIRATLITLSLRSTRPTAPMPRSASSIATACPMPLPAPVMTADLPLMFMVISSSGRLVLAPRGRYGFPSPAVGLPRSRGRVQLRLDRFEAIVELVEPCQDGLLGAMDALEDAGDVPGHGQAGLLGDRVGQLVLGQLEVDHPPEGLLQDLEEGRSPHEALETL